MAVIRVQVNLENVTMLPRDRVVNTFHFLGDSKAAVADDVAVWLDGFYNDARTGGDSIASCLSAAIKRGTEVHAIRCYDLAEPEIREPEVRMLTLGAAAGVTKLPNEVALCLSFRGPVNNARRRGRIYLGPWRDGVLAAELDDSAPATWLCTTVLQSGEALMAAAGGTWVVRSEVGGFTTPVTRGWVDNAWDTIRSRGTLADTRYEWGAEVVG